MIKSPMFTGSKFSVIKIFSIIQRCIHEMKLKKLKNTIETRFYLNNIVRCDEKYSKKKKEKCVEERI